MITNFQHGQTRYSLLVAPEGRREREIRLEDIKADPTILAKKHKGKGTYGSNQYARKEIREV